MAKYHALLVKDSNGWHGEFGDYSKAAVKEEWRFIKHNQEKGAKHYIVTFDDSVLDGVRQEIRKLEAQEQAN